MVGQVKSDPFSDLFPTDPAPAETVDIGAVLREHTIDVQLSAPPVDDGMASSDLPEGDALCDLVSAIEQNTLRLEQCIQAINNLGEIVQFMSDGTRNMFGFFNQIGQDMATMSLPDKIKALTAMMKG